MDLALIKSKLKTILTKFKGVDYETEAGWEIVSDIEEDVRSLYCEVIGGHEFVFDMCCYWQHKYCYRCGTSQYPDLAKKRCNILDAEMGRMTEEEYLEKIKAES